MPVTNHSTQLEFSIKREIGYKLFVPKQYNSTASWPLILFLHGIKKRGNDLSLLDSYGLIKHAEAAEAFPYFVLAPQCPAFTSWVGIRHEVIQLVSQVISSHNIDRSKVYVTGFSMGGNGAWDIAVHSPELFATAVPIAGWYEGEAAAHINIPVWAIHGADDDVVSVTGSTKMVEAMKAEGKDVKCTIYPGLKHDYKVMEKIYSDPALYEWLKKKGER